jgi:hypothetical protein
MPRSLLLAILFLLAGFALFAGGQKETSQKVPEPSTQCETGNCMTCHNTVFTGFKESPLSTTRDEAPAHSCTGCHAPEATEPDKRDD